MISALSTWYIALNQALTLPQYLSIRPLSPITLPLALFSISPTLPIFPPPSPLPWHSPSPHILTLLFPNCLHLLPIFTYSLPLSPWPWHSPSPHIFPLPSPTLPPPAPTFPSVSCTLPMPSPLPWHSSSPHIFPLLSPTLPPPAPTFPPVSCTLPMPSVFPWHSPSPHLFLYSSPLPHSSPFCLYPAPLFPHYPHFLHPLFRHSTLTSYQWCGSWKNTILWLGGRGAVLCL